MWSLPERTPALHELRLEVGRILAGFQGGLHRSAIKDRGAELISFRPYQPGDTIRDVDWKASARISDDDLVLVSRESAPDREIRVVIIADLGATMSAPIWKGMCAQSIVQLFALSAFRSSDPCMVIGLGAPEGMISSGFMYNEQALTLFLKACDSTTHRRALIAPTRSLTAYLEELELVNTLIVCVSDLATRAHESFRAIAKLDIEKANIVTYSIVLDEWTGFVPEASLLRVAHPGTGKLATMDLRPGGEFEQQVDAFRSRLEDHRAIGRSVGARIIQFVLSGKEPFRDLARAWLRYEPS